MKKVLLIIIDACAARLVEPALQAGKLPNLNRLQQAATLHGEMIAVFPSITPAATSSIITGCYPRQHGVSGAYWYIPAEQRVVFFDYDIWGIMEDGIGQFMMDFLVELNEKHLKAPTLYQTIEQGGLRAANLNFLIYHGNRKHEMAMPLLLKLWPGVPTVVTTHGPEILYFGDFLKTPLQPGDKPLKAQGGLFHRFGFNDVATGQLLKQLAELRIFPDFTLAYFPDNDASSHAVGPEKALETLAQTDALLGEVFAAYGGLEQMLADLCIILSGDHSQSDVVEDAIESAILLDDVLATFTIAAAGAAMGAEDDLVVCPNLRAMQVYFHTPRRDHVRQVIDHLLAEARVDQVIWHSNLFGEEQPRFFIATQERGRLCFWPGNEGAQQAKDDYGCIWSWEGDLRCVDAQVGADGILVWGVYPNAFERIVGVLEASQAANLWATAQPGYEFCLKHTLTHPGGGSHGSLHVLDSLSPIWIAGAPSTLTLPAHPRTVDLAPLCLSILGLPVERTAGESHSDTVRR